MAELLEKNIEVAVSENGLEYSHYVVQSRALTHLDGDGLKPVQRRLFYAAYDLGLKPSSNTIKAMRVVGETMGRFHPHGDSSVAGALANLTQPFKNRVPLIHYQGSMGVEFGDEPTAPRYYEITLLPAAWELVRDLPYNTVPFKPSEVSADDLEPVQLPVRWPVGIISGGEGIAVGFASNIPSHNPDEVMNAVIAYFNNKLKKPKDILKYIKGPDFARGGEVLGVDGIESYLTEGVGKFTIRGKYNIKDLPRGKSSITFYELPWQVSSESVKQAIDKNQESGRFKEVQEVKILSSGELGVALEITLKAGSNADNVINDLFKYTPCQVSFTVNNTGLIGGRPEMRVSVFQMVQEFGEFRKQCFINKTNHLLKKLEVDKERLEGIFKITVDIDKAIAIIRNAKNADIATKELMGAFDLTETQAGYVLSMRLRQLTQADKLQIEKDLQEIVKQVANLKAILNDENLLNKEIIKELEETKKIISSPRRTTIENISNEDMEQAQKDAVRQERLLGRNVSCFIEVTPTEVRKLVELPQDLRANSKLVETTSLGSVLVVTENGECESVNVESLQLSKYAPLSKLGTGKSKVVGLISPEHQALIVTDKGNVNIVNQPIKEGTLVSLATDEKVMTVFAINNQVADLVFLSVDGKMSRFPLDQVRSTRQGAGTIAGVKMKEKLVNCVLIQSGQIIGTETKDEVKFTEESDCPSKNRGGQGYLLHKSKQPMTNLFVATYDEIDNTMAVVTPRGARGQVKW